jgi:hypothetical protein
MAEAAKLSLDEVPVPTDVSTAVDERERRHHSPPCSRVGGRIAGAAGRLDRIELGG